MRNRNLRVAAPSLCSPATAVASLGAGLEAMSLADDVEADIARAPKPRVPVGGMLSPRASRAVGATSVLNASRILADAAWADTHPASGGAPLSGEALALAVQLDLAAALSWPTGSLSPPVLSPARTRDNVPAVGSPPPSAKRVRSNAGKENE